MQKSFPSHPDFPTIILFLVPGLILSSLQAITPQSLDMMRVYFLAGAVGFIGFLLARVGLIPRLQLWGQYALGFTLGIAALLLFLMVSPMATLGIAALRVAPWPLYGRLSRLSCVWREQGC